MGNNIIDELYRIYQTENELDAQIFFKEKRRVMELKGDYSLIPTLENYIKSQSNLIPNYFKSNIDLKKHDFRVIQEIVNAFEMLSTAVDLYMSDYLYDDGEDHSEEYEQYYENPRIQDLFNIDFKFLDEAYNNYCFLNVDCYEKIKTFIKYVRINKVLESIYQNGSWRNVNIEELIYNLYDKIKDKSIFKDIDSEMAIQEYLLFDNIKDKCSRISLLTFDKYRPQLTSNKQLRAEFGKLIFCKNLLIYYKTGILPDKEGRIDFRITELEEIKLIEDFKKLYSKKFSSENFKERQENFILNPTILINGFKLNKMKSVIQGNKQILGFLISTGNFLEQDKVYMLLHIEISDVTNPCSNYEIQLNVIPQGSLNSRIQLIRLDNWETVQPHKNIANKLSTTTHIHLYNVFDLLRGKGNGNFDIAYNVNDVSTDFKKALNMFLTIIDFDLQVKNDIYKSVLQSINDHKNAILSTDLQHSN